MIVAHLPVIQVVIPLISAPVCLVLRRPAAAWTVALAVTWFSLAVALSLLGEVMIGGPISYPREASATALRGLRQRCRTRRPPTRAWIGQQRNQRGPSGLLRGSTNPAYG